MIDTVLDLAAIAVVLPFDARRFAAALGCSGIVDAANVVWVSVVGSDDLLTTVEQQLLIPDHRFEKSLERSRSHVLPQRDGFDILARDIRQQSAYIDQQQSSPLWTNKTTGKPSQKLTEQFAELGNIVERHRATFRGFHMEY